VTKRVSVKGKGAALFFDGETPELSQQPVTDQPVLETSRSTLGTPADDDADAAEGYELREAQIEGAVATSASEPASWLASTLAPRPDGTRAGVPEADAADDLLVELIRKTIKVPGREVAFIRTTPSEKARLADVAYTFKRDGKRISETDVARIGLNYVLEDFARRGDASMLARVIAALLA
jgi:hypothetical protein